MKKEIFALALMAAMIGFALFNVHYIERLTQETKDLVSNSCESLELGDTEKALDLADRTIDMWCASDTYLHAVIPHGQIEALSDELYAFYSSIKGEDISQVLSQGKLICDHMDSFLHSEMPNLGSIF